MDDATRDHWFEDLADHLGGAYLRYSFTKGTEQEVGFLVDALGLEPGMRVLDVGCGPGRHAHALGRLGLVVHGVDISERFVELARRDAPPDRARTQVAEDACYASADYAEGLRAKAEKRPPAFTGR